MKGSQCVQPEHKQEGKEKISLETGAAVTTQFGD
jgi:hypothetical protein